MHRRSNDTSAKGLILLMVFIITIFSLAIFEAQRRLETMSPTTLGSASPAIAATCTTDSECGCTDDCLDGADLKK